MNIPHTVTEFLDQQNQLDERTWEDIMMDAVLEQDPSEGYSLVIRMLTALLGHHVDGLKLKMEQGDIEEVMLWTRDLTKLDDVLTMMKQLNM